MRSDKKFIQYRALHEARAMKCISDGTCEPLNERLAKEVGIEKYLNALGFFAVIDSNKKELILADIYKVFKHNNNTRLYLDINTGRYYSLEKVKL